MDSLSICEKGTPHMQDARHQREVIVSALYQQRMLNPGQPSLTLTDFEQLLGVPKAKFEFSLWYLTESQFVKRTDNGNHSIAIKGVELAEMALSGGRA